MFKKLVFRWHKKFLDGFTSLKYGFRPGQPQITDGIAAVAGLIIIDARPVLKTIAHSNGTSSGSVHLRNEFNFSNVHGIMNTSGLVQSK